MKLLNLFQIIISLLLIGAILMQSRGTGLSTLFGGSEFYQTRRGLEKILFIVTIILAVAFISLSLTNFLLSK